MTEWAVLTGDIVKSSDMTSDELTRTFKGLQDAAQVIESWQDAPVYFTRFRGDGWQIVVKPALCLRALSALRAAVRRSGKGFETRIGIGLGTAVIHDGDLAGAEGPAFVRSGHALDQMKRGSLLAAPDAPQALRVTLPLVDHIIKGWTVRQADIAYLMLTLEGPTQADVADLLNLTQQTVQQQIDSSGIAKLHEACTILEETS
ncbi:MAG: hypothetical protein ACSHXB_07385 [Sulfitobacter sp.]